MKWFVNLKTVVKLITAFIIVSIILAFVGIYGLANMTKLNVKLDKMYTQSLLPVQNISAVEIAYQRLRINIRDIQGAQTKEEKDKFLDIMKGLKTDIDKRILTYSDQNLPPEHNDIFKKFTPAWQSYNQLLEQAIELSYEGKNGEFRALLEGELRKSGDHLNAVLDELIQYNVKSAEKANMDGNATYASSKTVTIVIIVLSILISVSFGYLISQIIARPLNRVVKLVDQVAKGDLRETTDIDSKDEIGRLAASINDMVISLRSTVSGILVSAESVSAAAQQISASTEEIASGSTSQAEAAQTMNELFKELSTAINAVAHSAGEASELSSQTTAIAQNGDKVIRSSIEGMSAVNVQMSRLKEDSNKIGEIIEVIDDIADQTNLLALNAAIEAARAGDQGRGFAVVADEVRKLAERSSEATKQITAIIKGMQENTQQSVKAVSDGVISSQKTGEAFEHIISMVNQSASKVTEIAAASEQQAAQSSEVLISIESISAATEEAAASSEESASTAQSLAGLAEELNHSVGFFKIN